MTSDPNAPQSFNPYGAPVPDHASGPSGGLGLRPTYRSTQKLTTALKAIYVLQMISAIAGIGVGFFSMSISPEELESAELNNKMLAFIAVSLGFGCGNLLLLLVNAIVHCVWTYRSNQNCRALGATAMQYTPGWAVGWFFVPFANLIMPYRVAVEIYTESDREPASVTNSADTNALNQPMDVTSVTKASGSTAFIGWWWCLYILCGLLNNASFRLSMGNDPNMVRAGEWAGIVAEFFGFFAAFLALKYVAATFSRQRSTAVRIGTEKPTGEADNANPFARQ